MAVEVRSVAEARYAVLDGWRAISIVLVMAGHLLPLGPKSWQLNVTVASLGMAMFFSLSGFLILKTLMDKRNAGNFFISRMFRILPLCIVYVLVVGLISRQGSGYYLQYFFFLENYNLPPEDAPYQLQKLLTHLWSLCVEVHFYVFIGLWMAITRFKAVWVVPLLLCAITMGKLILPNPVGDQSAQDFWRVDEILAGGVVALLVGGQISSAVIQRLKAIPVPVVILLLAASCHPVFEAHGFLALRPYCALVLIAQTIDRAQSPHLALLRSAPARYIAGISYALYVLHLSATAGWLGTGDSKLVIYAKRPISILLAWAGAHLSTRYLEKPAMRLGRRLIVRYGI